MASSRQSEIDAVDALHALALIVMFIAWLGFEIFNIVTSRNSLNEIFGGGMTDDFMVLLLLVAIGGVDFAGIFRMVFQKEDREMNSWVDWGLFIGWVVIASSNALLTWWDVAVKVQANRAKLTPDGVDTSIIFYTFPVIIAMMVLCMRCLLVYLFAGMLKRFIADKTGFGGLVRTVTRVTGMEPNQNPVGYPKTASIPPSARAQAQMSQRPAVAGGAARPGGSPNRPNRFQPGQGGGGSPSYYSMSGRPTTPVDDEDDGGPGGVK